MPTTLIIVAAVAILIILLATASYKVCPADRVMVITGPGGRRFVSGGSAFIIPFIMRVDWLSLGAVQSLLRTDTPIPTKDAILIDVNAVANFQIASETMTVDENGKQVKALENAAKNYLNQSKERMEKDVTQVLLGKLREVIGKTTLALKNGAKTYTLGTVDYKVSDTAVRKAITGVEDGVKEEEIKLEREESSGEYAVAKTSIGKKVSFKMTSWVPVWTGYDHYYYALNDTYSDGLTFNADSVKVTVGGKALTAGKDYKVTNETGKFHILFAPTADNSSDIIAAKTTFPVGAKVLVTYDMTVNKNAHVDGVDTNTSEVEYSHNPNTVTDHQKTPGDTTYVYVGKFTLTKTDTNNVPLAGAVFNIKDAKNTPVKFVKVGNNEYRVADSTEAATASADITTTDEKNGVITLKGMYGAYTVTETKSPFGGSILPEFTLTVGVAQSTDHNTSTSSLTAFGQDSNKLASKSSDDGVTVINARNIADMPKTGAVWLSIFGVMTVLLAGASALLLRRKA